MLVNSPFILCVKVYLSELIAAEDGDEECGDEERYEISSISYLIIFGNALQQNNHINVPQLCVGQRCG